MPPPAYVILFGGPFQVRRGSFPPAGPSIITHISKGSQKANIGISSAVGSSVSSRQGPTRGPYLRECRALKHCAYIDTSTMLDSVLVTGNRSLSRSVLGSSQPSDQPRATTLSDPPLRGPSGATLGRPLWFRRGRYPVVTQPGPELSCCPTRSFAPSGKVGVTLPEAGTVSSFMFDYSPRSVSDLGRFGFAFQPLARMP